MNSYTYEDNNTATPLETYEWDNLWIEHANKDNLPRILYIGDSISCATRIFATEKAEGKLFFDGCGTSKAPDNPFFFDTVRLFAKQEKTRDAVIFNNGLHGWHLSGKEYSEAYERFIGFLLEEFKGTPVFLLLTTYIKSSEERIAKVIDRNRQVQALAEKYGLPVIDFYSASKDIAHLLSADGVHFTSEGYKVLAELLVNTLTQYLKL